MFRMFFFFSSIFSVASAAAQSMPRSLSVRKTVVTMKKIRRRKAMSASDDDGISSEALDLRSKPPPLIAIGQFSSTWREMRSAPATCSASSTSIMYR
jgi:hypothetical protein